MHRIPAYPCLCFPFKKSLCGNHTSVPSHCLVLHVLHLPKKQKVSLGQGWLQPAGASDRLRCCNVIILGDWVSLWNSPGWCYLYGCAVCCMCSLGLPESIYPPQILTVGIEDPCVGLGLLAPRREGAPTLWFLSGLFTAAGATHRAFPLQLMTFQPLQMWPLITKGQY